MSKNLLTVLLAVLTVIVASALLVSAADAALPGDWAYGVDRAMENLRLRLAVDHQQRALVEQLLAQERLREAQTLERRGETESVEALRQEARLRLLAAKAAAPNVGPKKDKPGGKFAPKTIPPTQTTAQSATPAKPSKHGGYCDGTIGTNHPVGEKLAVEFEVSYTEIIGWFCQGYGFGEISLAYQIRAQKGVPAAEVFALRAGGMNWGKIKHHYGLNGKGAAPE